MRKTLLRTLIVIAAVALVGAGAAEAIKLRIGNIIITGDGGFTPTKLPKHENAPIRLYGHAKFSTADGTRPSPLRKLVLEFDKHGAVETRGLPKCTQAKLIATTTAAARRNCSGSIVGTGFGTALVELPEQRGIKASSPLTLFNGPRVHGNPVGPRPRPPRLPGTDDLRHPDRDPEDQQRPLRLQDGRRLPADRQRLRLAALRPPVDRPQMEVQRRDAQLRQRPLRRRPASGQGPVHLQGRQLRPGHGLQTLPGAQVAILDSRRYPVGTGLFRRR